MDFVFGSDRVFATTRRVVVYKHNFMTFRSCVLCYQLSPMWSAQILFVLQFILLTCVLSDGTFECGDHGRFEYCIDEIPGCVIGCHCHPGYYFDTDTKICEPNTKLIEHYRRDIALTTTRGQKIEVTPNTLVYDTEPASSTDKIDGSVDEITKDANDLGDWLYNQFFKTIENQVINNTNDKGISTRRGASQPTMKIPKRSKKSRKGGKSSKQKVKKEQLRRKLLRITENDSLFDISSKSSSDSSDSSSSGDSSSIEYEVNENNHHKHEDGEHGHKKIVMVNKKPKQPLPSFIFLPNLDTPFYPPIGLPPPPIVPMYPMVPVPPVPLCPITGCIDNINVATTSSAPNTTTAQAATTTSISTVPTNTTEPSSVPETTADAIATNDTITSDVPKTDTRALRLKHKKKKKAAKLLNNDTSKADTEQGLNGLKYFERQKILKRLKEKMGNPSAKLFMGPWKKNKKIYSNKFMDQNVDTETQFLDNEIVDNELLNNERNQKLMREGSFPDNVDFRYITELIHRVDLNNKTNDLPPIEYNPLDSIELQEKQFSDYSVPLYTPDGRRTSHPKHHKSDESYYANLGRQIATMIRGIDKQENVELVETSNNIKNDQYLKNNSPTSFWERFVRSPLAYLKTKNKKFEYLKRSNELLFDIENKVEVIASTAPSLTLQEIENVVKVMEDAKKKIQSKNKSSMKNPETSRKNLNIDLWPQKSRNSRHDFQNSVLPYFNKIRQDKNANNYETNKSNIAKPNVDLPGLRMHSSQKFVAWNGTNFNKIIKLINQTYKIPTIATPLFNKKYTQNNYNSENTNKIHQIPALANQFSQNTIKQSFPNQQVNPYLLHHRRYFQDNSNNYYVNRNVELSYFSPVKRITGVPQLYFPEINHFDYID
ncbi:uncharacterized protein LOC123873760 [Maniola jurtina]|uniref:uncharacterized protein LOC123873760 n=1 Tax=Maniola jurtina TaxID=191418 RepID=UPI001E68FA87|nr:uncharacterized protein LOC123873760 [Maniola jurtina]XP_045774731.1 uncharacterized protein LOC123873760 [Maniola jurtina]XP_045774732.1 uncharacterized protein LOC123873760 [Maniola jurtina]